MITSTSNQHVKNVIALKKKAKERKAQDVFLVEGIKMFLEVPEHLRRETYVTEGFLQKNAANIPRSLMQRIGHEEGWEIVSDKVFAAMSDTQSPQGVISIVGQHHYKMEDLLGKAGKPLVMVLENLQDPGNLGTIIRTAEGAGVTGVLMTSSTVDIYNPKVTRSTMGSIYRVPFVYTDDLAGGINWLKAQGLGIYAAHLKGQHAYDQEDYRKGCAFLIGNESKGLTDKTADMADHYIRIPMAGKVESLNAAVASSILMYEAARQRR